MNLPLMSIVYTVYNQERYVRESLGSALAQDYENLEIVVSVFGLSILGIWYTIQQAV